MLQYDRVNIWYLFAGSNVLLCCEFTCYNEILLGKIGELTKNYGLVRREKKKGKMGSFLGIISSSLLLILHFQIPITLRVYSVSDQPLKTQQPISYLRWTTNLQNTVHTYTCMQTHTPTHTPTHTHPHPHTPHTPSCLLLSTANRLFSSDSPSPTNLRAWSTSTSLK